MFVVLEYMLNLHISFNTQFFGVQMNYKTTSSNIINSILCVLYEAKKTFLKNSTLKLNVSGNNFCKNINISLNSPYRCTEIWKTRNVTQPTKLIYINMSLKSVSHTCEATETPCSPNQSNIFLTVQSPFKQPMAQNLLAHLISGLNKPFFKEQTQTIHPTQNIAGSSQTVEEERLTASKSENMNTTASDSHPINLGRPYCSDRKRNISEHSDDICFLDESNNDNCELLWYDDEDNDSSDDDSSISDVDQLSETLENPEEENLENSIYKDPMCKSNIKKVRFNLSPEIHTMYAWSYAYKAARQGHWERFARDRDRFRRRIENTSKYLNPILSPEHRSFIYNTRFRNDV